MMATVILVEENRAYARSDDKKIIRRWKRSAEKSRIPYLVLEDTTDDYGRNVYSIEIPHGIGRKAAFLLIPQLPATITEGERLAALERLSIEEQIAHDNQPVT